MSILKRIEETKRLWNILMPHIPPPADTVFVAWTTRFTESAVEAGLLRGSKKFAARKIDASFDSAHAHKYVSGVIKHEFEAQKENNQMTQIPTKITIEETPEEFRARVDSGDIFAAKAKAYVDGGAPNLPINELTAFVNQ
jgi:hypothetical protein